MNLIIPHNLLSYLNLTLRLSVSKIRKIVEFRFLLRSEMYLIFIAFAGASVNGR